MTPPPISVIVPARDARSTLPATLAGLGDQRDVEDFEVIVVDDGSTDGTADLARASPLRPRVLSAAGVGAAESRNLGARAARAGALAFLDADCQPVPGWLAAGLEALGDADLVQGPICAPPGARVGPYDRVLVTPRASPLFESANLFVTREVFQGVGGFEDWLGAGGRPMGEDVLFGWRARRLGARVAFSDRAVVHHAVIPRGAWDYIAEHARVRFFPVLARRIPELRHAFFYRGYFLTSRSAAFDLALAGAAVALTARRPAALVLAAPYARTVAAHSTRWGRRRAPAIALARLAADGLSAGALVVGSARARTLVL